MMMPEVCEQCGLYKHGCLTPLMPGNGAAKPDIIFIGEAPGENEDQQGIPFVGKAGKKLRDSIEMAELPLDKIRFTNTVRCRPPDNRTPTNKEIQCCSQFLVEELEQTQPKIVVLLGASPLKAVLGLSPISTYQGQVIERDGVKYIPCWHPSYVQRQGDRGIAQDDWISTFGTILETFYGEQQEQPTTTHQYLYPMSIEDLLAMRDELLADGGLIACDIETDSLRIDDPKNRILSIAFANSSKAWSFPVDHKDSWWDETERCWVHQVIDEVLTKCRIINHNIKFDCKMIRHFLGIDFIPAGDTIQLSRLINPAALEHGLKRLAGVHVQMFDYDEELQQYVAAHPDCNPAKGGTYDNVPLEVLLPYGNKDVVAVVLLHNELYPQLTEKQRALYEQMIVKADYALGKIEENGFKLDYWLINRYRNVYQAIMDYKYKPALDADKHVKQFLHADAVYTNFELHGIIKKRKVGKKDVCTIEYEGQIYEFDKKKWHTNYLKNKKNFEALNTQLGPHKRLKPKIFNPGSQDQVSPILFDYKKMTPEGHTETGQPSIKRDLLKKVIFNIKEKGNTVDQFLYDYMDWKLLSTINIKTFKPMMQPGSVWYGADQRVRSNLTIGGAATGRTSSAQPNLQNIPAIEKEPGSVLQYLPAKNVFTHTFDGGGLAMLDYSGMELRVMCSIANIKGMIDVFNRKGDVHRYVSSFIYKKPEDQITKDERYRGKWSNWSLLYLGGANTLFRLYSHLGLTKEEADYIAKTYYAEFPELGQYHQRIIEFVDEYGYVESVFGRVLVLSGVHSSREAERKDAYRTAVNMPIQGPASDTLMAALAIVNLLMRGKGYRSMFVNTVHDSIVLDYHPDERDELVKLCQDVMENIKDYAAEFMPGLDFSWLRVPLKADVEYGERYGAYGFRQSLVCDDCGTPLTFVQMHDLILDDKKNIVAECLCENCQKTHIKSVKPIVYNSIDADAVQFEHTWQQVLSNRSYDGKRQPRLEL